jgi:hypothetical protein
MAHWLGVTAHRFRSVGVSPPASGGLLYCPVVVVVTLSAGERQPDAAGALTGSGVTVAQRVRRRSSAYRFSLIGLTGCAGRCPVGIRADSLTCLHPEKSR